MKLRNQAYFGKFRYDFKMNCSEIRENSVFSVREISREIEFKQT